MAPDRYRFGDTRFTQKTGERLERCLSKNKTFLQLDVSHSSLNDATINAYCDVLEKNTTIDHFLLPKATFSEAILTDILLCLSENTVLISFDLRGSSLTDSVGKALCRFLRRNRHQFVSFKNAAFTDRAVSDILESICGDGTRLSGVDFDNSKLTDVTSKALCRFIRENSHVQALDFQSATFTDVGLEEILLALCDNTTLDHIAFASCPLTDSIVKPMCKFIKGDCSIRSLNFQSATFTDAGLEKILLGLCGNKTLDLLQFGCSNVTDGLCDAMCTFLQCNTTLKSLRFDKAKFSNSTLSNIFLNLCKNTKLVSLDFNGCEFTNKVGSAIGRFSQENNSVKILWFSKSSFTDSTAVDLFLSLCKNKQLEILEFDNSPLTDGVSNGLCQFIRENSKMHALRFKNARFTDAMLSNIFLGLSQNVTVAYLDFNKCEVTDRVGSALSTFVQTTQCPLVMFGEARFTDEGLSKILWSFSENERLKILIFDKSVLTDAASTTISKFIKENRSTAYLSFPVATFSDAAVSAIVQSFSESKAAPLLDFTSCKLTDASSEAICRFVRENQTVRNLSFQEANFNDATVNAMLLALCGNTSLQVLDLDKSQLTDAIREPLCRFLKNDTTIRMFNFQNAGFTDRGVSNIMNSLAGNRTLRTLGACNSPLTDAVTEPLATFIKENEVTHTFWYPNRVLMDNEFLRILESGHEDAYMSSLQDFESLDVQEFDKLAKLLGAMMSSNVEENTDPKELDRSPNTQPRDSLSLPQMISVCGKTGGEDSGNNPANTAREASSTSWEESQSIFGPRKKRNTEFYRHPTYEVEVEKEKKQTADAGTQTDNEIGSSAETLSDGTEGSPNKEVHWYKKHWEKKKSAAPCPTKYVSDVETQTRTNNQSHNDSESHEKTETVFREIRTFYPEREVRRITVEPKPMQDARTQTDHPARATKNERRTTSEGEDGASDEVKFDRQLSSNTTEKWETCETLWGPLKKPTQSTATRTGNVEKEVADTDTQTPKEADFSFQKLKEQGVIWVIFGLSREEPIDVKTFKISSLDMSGRLPDWVSPSLHATEGSTTAKTPLWDKNRDDCRRLVSRLEKENSLLTKHRADLVNVVRVERLWDTLLSLNVINKEERDDIIATGVTNAKQVGQLIDHLQNGPVWRFHAFLRACMKKNQEHVLDIMEIDRKPYRNDHPDE